MQSIQYRWLKSSGWIPDLPTVEAGESGSRRIVLAFGARHLLQEGNLLSELHDHFPGAAFIGCSTSGEIAGEEISDNSLVATVLSFDHTRFQIASTKIDDGKSSYEAGKELAQKLNEASLRHVFVVSDGLNVNGSDLARGIMSGVPEDVSVTGGLSGDGTDFAETWVVADVEAGPRRIAAFGLYGDRLRIGYGSMGGWEPFGPVRKITRAEGNVLYEFDERTALDLYKTYLGAHAEELPSSALLFPIVVKHRENLDGENALDGVTRTILSVNEQDRSMTFAGDIPQGGTAQLMKTNIDNLVDGATKAGEISIAGFGKGQPNLAVLVSCVGRKLVMKQRIEEELEAIRDVLGGDTTIAGFYSYGELSPWSQGKVSRLHNQTMTVTLFAED